MTKGLMLLMLGGLGAGAYFVFRPKAVPLNADMTCPPGYKRANRWGEEVCLEDGGKPAGMPDTADGSEPWGVIPDDIMAKYQSIIYGHGTPNDCKDVLEFIDHLAPETQAEEDWLATVHSQVTTACATNVSLATNPPPLPAWIPDSLVADYIGCWQRVDCDINAISGALLNNINAMYGMVSSTELNLAYDAINALQARYAGAVSGLPHVGDCGCAACREENVGQDEEPCCEACARAGVGSCSCQQQALEDQYATGGA